MAASFDHDDMSDHSSQPEDVPKMISGSLVFTKELFLQHPPPADLAWMTMTMQKFRPVYPAD